MLGYENLCCVISHNGLPILENQNLKMKILDVNQNYTIVAETEVCLTPSSTLLWAGFSDEGEIYTYDSEGILRAFSFVMGKNWVPVLDIKQKYNIEPEKFWIVFINEKDIS
jgi:chromosome transmission fidelity protein 4